MKTKIISTAIVLLILTCSVDGQILRKSQSFHRSGTKAWIVENGDSFAINQNVLIVKPKSDVQVLSPKLKLLRTSKLGFIEIQVPKEISIEKYAEDLENSGNFDYIEYSAEWKCCFIPNDQYYNYQWHLDSISVPLAWNLTMGNPNVKLAIIDTGVDAGHNDLGYGNDSYSHVNITEGYNYTNDSIYTTPVFNHGTIVAGIAGAKTNNGFCIAGISGGNQSAGISIIPYCMGNAADFNTTHIGDAIVDAVDKGAKVINISMHSTASYSTDSAIEYAYGHGVTIVCSAGNKNSSIGYPASHTHTIAVGSIQQNNARAYNSNYGEGLDIVAPGVGILSTALNNTYTVASGTSFAAPLVSGAIALMLSISPDLSPYDIRYILHNTAYKIPSYTYNSEGWNDETGYGRLNVYEAVKASYKIIGENQLCGSEIYRIDNLPSNAVVDWSFWGEPSNNNLIQQNYPYQNQCMVNLDDLQTIDDFLCATISDSISGHVICVARKSISTGWNFYGTYQVREISTLNLIREGIIRNHSNIWLNRYQQAIISSPFFSNSTISYIPTGNVLWLFNNDSMTISFNSADQKIEIRGTSINDCNNFMFKATAVFQIIEPILSVSENQIAISLEQQDCGCGKDPSWDLEIYNGLTGQKVYKKNIDGWQAIIKTTNWRAGTYIVKTKIYDNVVTNKVVIK